MHNLRRGVDARNEAVLDGLRAYVPAILEPLAALGPRLWSVIETLPTVGRVLFVAHLRMPRPTIRCSAAGTR